MCSGETGVEGGGCGVKMKRLRGSHWDAGSDLDSGENATDTRKWPKANAWVLVGGARTGAGGEQVGTLELG